MIYHKYCVTECENLGPRKNVHFLEVSTFGGFAVFMVCQVSLFDQLFGFIHEIVKYVPK